MCKAACSPRGPNLHPGWFVPVTLGWSGPGADAPYGRRAGAWPVSSRGWDVTQVSPAPESPPMLCLSH